MNHIHVLFFATLRERTGTRSIDFEIPTDSTIRDLKRALSTAYPSLALSMPTVLTSVNQEYAFDEALIPANAEIALFPPVSGG
jgi:molybdopterin converting factor subunit 1